MTPRKSLGQVGHVPLTPPCRCGYPLLRSDRRCPRCDALKRANDVRVRRAELRKAVAGMGDDARPAVAAILEDPVWWQQSMRVEKLLGAIPRVGPARAARMLRGAGVSVPGATVVGLTPGRREALVRRVRGG